VLRHTDRAHRTRRQERSAKKTRHLIQAPGFKGSAADTAAGRWCGGIRRLQVDCFAGIRRERMP